MNTLAQQLHADGMMQLRGDRHHGGVDLAEERLQVGIADGLEVRGDFLAGFVDRIDDSNQAHVIEGIQQSRVDTSQVAGADDGDAQIIHAALLRSRARPWRPSCWP